MDLVDSLQRVERNGLSTVVWAMAHVQAFRMEDPTGGSPAGMPVGEKTGGQ